MGIQHKFPYLSRYLRFTSHIPNETKKNTNELTIQKFQYPKSQQIFEKITQISRDDLDLVGHIINQKLGNIYTKKIKKNTFLVSQQKKKEKKEIKTQFDVKLVGFEANKKIKVIKEIRTLMNLGLKESKELVEGFPNIVMRGVKEEKSKEIKKQLEDVGGKIEIL